VAARAGAAVLHLLHGRSVLVHIMVLLAVTVLAVAAGVALVANAMLLSGHDVRIVLVTVAASAVVSLLVGGLFGRRLAAAAGVGESRSRPGAPTGGTTAPCTSPPGTTATAWASQGSSCSRMWFSRT